MDPIIRFAEYAEQEARLLRVSLRGIGMLRAVPLAVTFREAAGRGSHEETSPGISMDQAQKLAQFAETETERGYPLLHAHSLVGLWAAFEAGVEDMLVGFLVNDPGALQQEAFQRTRIRLAEFELLEKEERMRLLLGEFERNQGAARRQGTDRFEALLEPFGLSGPVDADVKRDILEMHHIRNILVHLAGRADRRIVDGCPWLGLSPGEEVKVSPEAMVRYENSVASYVRELIYRCGDKFGIGLRTKEKEGKPASEGGGVRGVGAGEEGSF